MRTATRTIGSAVSPPEPRCAAALEAASFVGFVLDFDCGAREVDGAEVDVEPPACRWFGPAVPRDVVVVAPGAA
jgi:hypothetical protein